MRRLTDLDLDGLPAAGPLLSRVPAIVLRDEGERFRVYVPQELAHDVAVAVLDAAAGLSNTGSGVSLTPDLPWTLGSGFSLTPMNRKATRRHEGHLPRPAHVAAAQRAETPLRRRGRRSRFARARHRVLPRQAAWHPRCLRPRQVATSARARRGETRRSSASNYRTPEGAEFYRESVRLYERLSAELDFNLNVLAARPSHARALGPGARDDAGAGRGEQAARDQVERRRAAGDPRAVSAARRLGSTFLSDPRGALPRSGRDHPARRRGLGLCASRRPARGGDPSEHGGHGLRARGRPRDRGRDTARPHRVRAGRLCDRRLVVAGCRARAACDSRSRRTSCKPSSPSR